MKPRVKDMTNEEINNEISQLRKNLNLLPKGARKEKQTIYHRIWYLKNHETHLPKMCIYQKEIQFPDKIKPNREAIRDRIIDVYGGKCIRCGSTEKLVFHHVKPWTKRFDVSKLWLRPRLLEKELKKCVLICDCCHRKIHSQIRNEFDYVGHFKEFLESWDPDIVEDIPEDVAEPEEESGWHTVMGKGVWD